MTITSIRLVWLVSMVLVILITVGMIPGTILGTTILGTMEDGDGVIVPGAGMVGVVTGAGTIPGMIPGTMAMDGATMVGVITITIIPTGQAIRLTADSMVDAGML